jgi:hypothetical protein
MNRISESYGAQDDADLVDPMVLPDSVDSMTVPETADPISFHSSSSPPPRTGVGWGGGHAHIGPMPHDSQVASFPLSCVRRGEARREGPDGRPDERGLGGEGASERAGHSVEVAARLLAEILALDLGNLTPIQALTLLHRLQTAAREAVPWNDWMANLAGARDPADRQ